VEPTNGGLSIDVSRVQAGKEDCIKSREGYAPSRLIWLFIVVFAWVIAMSLNLWLPVKFAETNRSSRFIMLSMIT
jgi:hypothetical protein